MTKPDFHAYAQQYSDELFNNCLPFWENHAVDTENGGLYSSLDRAGSVFSGDKSVWLLARCAWIYARLCNVYGFREEWKRMSDNCFDFLTAHCIDREHGGRMYFWVTADGQPLRRRRYYFSETFFTMACAEYARAFGSREKLALARSYYDLVLRLYRDPASDPFHISPKFVDGVRPTRAYAPSMILLNVSHIMEECDPENLEKYRSEAAALTSDIFRWFVKPDLHALLEVTGANGEFLRSDTGCRTMNPGHTIEGCWFLLRQAADTGDGELAGKTAQLFDWAYEIGWDKEYGGIRAFVDVLGYPPEALEHDMKLWWPVCETLISSLRLYETTGDPRYWEIFRTTDEYATAHFRDPEFGEWYGYLNREGSPTLPACKGNLFKGVFHVPRMLMEVEQCLRRLEKS